MLKIKINPDKFDITLGGIEYENCCFFKGTYPNGAMAIVIWDEEGPVCDVTINLKAELGPNELTIANDFGTDIRKFLEDNGIATFAGRYEQSESGWCEYPVYAFNPEFIEKVRNIE